jgi:hypothetical protein
MLNAAVCGYLLLSHIAGRQRQSGGGGEGGGEGGGAGGGGGGGGGGKHLVATVAYAGLLLLAVPGSMRVFT